MATPALDRTVRVRPGNSRDLDDVMEVMDAAFGDTFGEAWTRSQCAGILPMAGVSLTVAREVDSGAVIGFSLSRTVANEAELLLLAVRALARRLHAARSRRWSVSRPSRSSRRQPRRRNVSPRRFHACWKAVQIVPRAKRRALRRIDARARPLIFICSAR